MGYKNYCYLLIMLLSLLCSCRKPTNKVEWRAGERQIEVHLERQSDTLFVLHLNNDQPFHSTWKLPYPVYRFDYGDINNDECPEIIVGVIKPTRFDPKPDRRLFIYRIADGSYIRPLWLGSRVGQPLEDFSVIRTTRPARIRTIEHERTGRFLVAEYQWRGFGLEFKGYIKREIDKQEATQLLNN